MNRAPADRSSNTAKEQHCRRSSCKPAGAQREYKPDRSLEKWS